MDRKTDGAAGDAAGRGRRRASGRRGRSAGVAGSAGRDGPAGAIGARFFSFAMADFRSEEHTSELQSLMRISYAVFCLKKKNTKERQTSLSVVRMQQD